MSLFGGIKSFKTDVLPSIKYNTGSIFDLNTGTFKQSYDNKWVCTGGIANAMSGIQGDGNTYKSTFMVSLIMRALGIYQNSNFMLVDTEDAIIQDLQRIARFNPFSPVNTEDEDRFIPIRGAVYDLGDILTIVRELAEEKKKHASDYIIETPFIDPISRERCRAWAPTFLAIDSLTEIVSEEEAKMLEEKGIDDKGTKRIFMVDGAKKTIFLRHLRRYCEQYGICVFVSAHLGNDINIESHVPQAAHLPFMRQNKRPKGTGSKFRMLMSTLIEARKATPYKDSTNKASQYPKGDTHMNEINKLLIAMIRCKSNISGSDFNYIVSQLDGYLDDLTCHDYICSGKPEVKKSNGCVGSDSGGWAPVIYPEATKATRKQIRSILQGSYEQRRATEILAHLKYMKEEWSQSALPFPIAHITPDKMLDAFNSSKTHKLADILNSRGYWTDHDPEGREYMSILDICSHIVE